MRSEKRGLEVWWCEGEEGGKSKWGGDWKGTERNWGHRRLGGCKGDVREGTYVETRG